MLLLGLCLWGILTWPTAPRVQAQKNALGTVADITGSGAAVQIATSGAAQWVQITAPSGNGAVVRFGDSNVSISRGAIVAAGGGQFLPPIPVGPSAGAATGLYQLSTIYCYIANGDKVTVTWGN